MPPRVITAGILLFWLAMTGWLIQREVVPMMIADASPTYQVDLTDEIGSPMVGWHVLRDGKRIGSATSKIIAHEDRSFEFRSSYHFDRLAFQGAKIKRVEYALRIGDDGVLRSFNAAIAAKLPFFPEVQGEMRGEVKNQKLRPRIFHEGVELKSIDLGEIDLQRQGNVVDPTHLVNRLRGLRAGQTWKVLWLDSSSIANNEVLTKFVPRAVMAPALLAEVKADTLEWNRKEVPCHKIEYFEPGKAPLARTWVRRVDGLVLQQEKDFLGITMIAERIAE